MSRVRGREDGKSSNLMRGSLLSAKCPLPALAVRTDFHCSLKKMPDVIGGLRAHLINYFQLFFLLNS